MNKECCMVQVAALAESLGVRVIIEYMDGRMVSRKNDDVGEVVHHIFGENSDCNAIGDDTGSYDATDRTSITLLYRPGNYDILY